jgi:hypothetical protein
VHGSLIPRDSCHPSLNLDAPLDSLGPESFDWTIEPEELEPGVRVLWLWRSDGGETRLRKQDSRR